MNLCEPNPLHQPINLKPGCRILYIEDLPVNTSMLRTFFELYAQGVVLLEAASATQGIKLAVDHQPDLIICDINLPDYSGIEVLQALRSRDVTRHIPVIGITADIGSDLAKARQADFDAFLTRPINWDRFRKIICQFLAQP